MTRKKTDPVIRHVQPGEIRMFTLNQYEVDKLHQGSPASLSLNFALFFLGVFISSLSSLLSAPPTNIRILIVFVVLTFVTAIAGIVLLGFWYVLRQSTNDLYQDLMAREPANPPAIQDGPVDA